MRLPDIINACCNSRSASLWTQRSKKKSHDNFQGPIGRLRQHIISYPEGGEESVMLFFERGLDKDFEKVCPKSPSGEAILEKMKQLTPSPNV